MTEPQYRYVWINLNKGEFSNSWDEQTHKLLSKKLLDEIALRGWKLIKYQCLNDEDFEFTAHFKLR